MTYEGIDYDCTIERDEMSKKFCESTFIGYVCENQDEITNLQMLSIDELKISKKRYHDDYYEMHLISGIKDKTVILSFNEKLRIDNGDYFANKIDFYSIKNQYKAIIMHFIQLTRQRGFQADDSFLKQYFDSLYFKLITKYLFIRCFFMYKNFEKNDARLVKMSENT